MASRRQSLAAFACYARGVTCVNHLQRFFISASNSRGVWDSRTRPAGPGDAGLVLAGGGLTRLRTWHDNTVPDPDRTFVAWRRVTLLVLAAALAGCPATPPTGPKPRASKRPVVAGSPVPSVRPSTAVGPGTGGGLISDNGLGIVSHDGAGLAGTVAIPAGVISNSGGALISDNGLGLISDNGLGLISDNGLGLISDNGLGVIANNGGGYRLMQAAGGPALPLAKGWVVLCAADGTILEDPAGSPYVARTDDRGGYRFEKTPVGPNLVVRVLLPGPVGDMVALLPRAAAGQARPAVAVDATSTLVMRFVLETYVAGQGEPQKVLDRLPGGEEAVTRERVVQAGEAAVPDFKPASVAAAIGQLRAKSPALDQQLEYVKRLLLVGQSNLGDGELATRITLNLPDGLVYDPRGRLVIADRFSGRIRVVELDGTIRTLAGTGEATFSGDGGPATQAALNGPEAVAYDDAGNLYVADGTNRVVRRVRPDGTIETVAGSGAKRVSGSPFVGGPAREVALGRPTALAWDAARKQLFLADSENHTIWKLTEGGRLEPVAGDPMGNRPPRPTPAIGFELISPQGLAVDAAGNLWVAQKSTPYLRKIDPAGLIHDVPLQGSAPDAWLDGASGLAIGPDGALYVADTGQDRIVRITPEGVLTTVVGQRGRPGPGDDGPALAVHLIRPEGVTFDPQGRLVVADSIHGQIRRLEPDGRVITVAGLPAGAQRGQLANQLALNRPTEAVLDPSGALLVADSLNAVVRRRAPDGTLSIVAGNGVKWSDGDGSPATEASFAGVGGLAYDPRQRLHVVDVEGGAVRRIEPDGTVTTVVRDVVGATAIAFDAKGDLYVTQSQVGRILRVPLSRGVATPEVVAGAGPGNRSTGDGGPAAAAGLNLPGAMAFDAAGDLYLVEVRGQRIRKIALSQGGAPISTVLASDVMQPDAGDPTDAPKAGFAAPNYLVLDPAGRFLISDFFRNAVLRVARDGTTEVIAGEGGKAFAGSGVDDGLRQPAGLVFDRAGGLFVMDSGNNQVKLVPAEALK